MFDCFFVSKATQSVGLLSYTFLRRTSQDDVVVPMIDFDISGHWAEPIIFSSQDDWSSNLKTILEWSPFTCKEELLEQPIVMTFTYLPNLLLGHQFEGIGRHGTKILIYNLWLNDEGVYELSFDDDDEAYASVLYLRKFTNFKIILRGKPVEQYHIAKHLLSPKKVIYKPQMRTGINEVVVEATLGYIPEAPFPVSGFNVYHKNRLIRVCSSVGVVSHAWVLEANFIEPAHDKQDFERSSVFIRLETKLKQILMEYWNAHCHLFGYQSPAERTMKYYAKTQKPPPTNQLDTDLSSSSAHEMNHNPPLQHPSYNELRNSGPIGLPAELPVTGIASGAGDQVKVKDSGSQSVEALCEDNIQLFMRCEEQRLQEIELKQKVEELEKQVEQAKRKCAQLAAHLETRRKQQTPQVL
ncbi:unnamed protein product [Linum tenue]|uniref:Morc S5 domain-containing protein n=1 Tax=Linum tenue TaxID=586396 RepID=A0AAV0I6Z5_9ROSI|nr:unnamed protein product [Linum tenue]